jgi:hypothetical protein
MTMNEVIITIGLYLLFGFVTFLIGYYAHAIINLKKDIEYAKEIDDLLKKFDEEDKRKK